MYSRSNITLLAVTVVLASYWVLRLVNNESALSSSAEIPIKTAFVDKPTEKASSAANHLTSELPLTKTHSAEVESKAVKNTAAAAASHQQRNNKDKQKDQPIPADQPASPTTKQLANNASETASLRLAAALQLPAVKASKTVVVTLSAKPTAAEKKASDSEPKKPKQAATHAPLDGVDQAESSIDTAAVAAAARSTQPGNISEDTEVEQSDTTTTTLAANSSEGEDQLHANDNDSSDPSDSNGSELTTLPSINPAQSPSEKQNEFSGNDITASVEITSEGTTSVTRPKVTTAFIEPELPSKKITSASAGTTQLHAQHTIADGDTLYSLARRFNTTVEILQSINKMSDNRLYTGNVLLYPADQ